MHHALRDSGADAIIADTRLLQRHGADLPLETLACLPHDSRLARVACGDAVARVAIGTAKVSYTSGSTGQPKGVCLPQSAMNAVAQSLWSACAALGLTRHLCTLPLPTLLENVAGVYAPLLNGAEICVPPLGEVGFSGSTSIDTQRFLDCLAAYAPESIILLPQTLLALVTALENGARRPSSLRFAAVGGGFVSKVLLERADRLGLPAYEGYGLTECASVVALNTPDARRSGSVGRPLTHARVRIGDGSRDPRVSQCDVRLPRRPGSEPLEIATGDLGRIDAAGFLHVDGRRKHMLHHLVRPQRFAGMARERSSLASPAIAQAAVFGEARPWHVAVVVPRTRQCHWRSDPRRRSHRVNSTLAGLRTNRVLDSRRCTVHAANGLATANGRIRRAAILVRYRPRIDACYYDSSEPRVAQGDLNDILRAAAEADFRGSRALLSASRHRRLPSGMREPRVPRRFLDQAYHHVKHTVPLLMACGSRVPERLELAA